MNLFQRDATLTLGRSGSLAGKRLTVVGRADLETVGGVYQWCEYRLLDSTGSEHILVEEDGDWRLFLAAGADPALSGPHLSNLTPGGDFTYAGKKHSVTFRGQSKVKRIEGDPPSGYAVGQIDNYLNAERGDLMVVATWSGSTPAEVFAGRTLPAGTVERAFGLPFRSAPYAASGSDWDFARTARGVWMGFLAVMVIGGIASNLDPWISYPSPPERKALPSLTLAPGETLSIEGQFWHPQSFERIEFRTTDGLREGQLLKLRSAGREGWLLRFAGASKQEWILLRKSEDPAPRTILQAATLRRGMRLDPATPGSITLLFQYQFSTPQDQTSWPTTNGSSASGQGLLETAGDQRKLLLWTADRSLLLTGRALDESPLPRS
ncbi:DUF4178 domain-containing protein [Nibricoccus sp. IMCC34717]|uniref:DUF4178 domain-containing protein n=1 Tax=Nibricoccus sp. IMCC34717 TaxID=3034021 RepID=UPI00384AB96B